MAASTLTIGEWVASSENGITVWTSDVTATTADYDLYTKRTPDGLDPHRPWTLVINSEVVTLDGATLPADLYVGWLASCDLTENNEVVVGDCVLYKADIMDAVEAACYAILMHPNLTVAEDVGTAEAKMYVPVAPYYIINLNGGGTLNAATCRFKILQ